MRLDAEQLQRVIDGLHYIKRYPQLWASADALPIVNFWNGFIAALKGVGLLDQYEAVRDALIKARGWELGSASVATYLRLQGEPEQAVIEKMFDLEIEVFRTLLEHLSNQEAARATRLDAAQLQDIIDMLHGMKRYPRMFASDDALPIVNFWNGFNDAALIGVELVEQYKGVRGELLKARGWELGSASVATYLRLQGEPEQAAIEKMFDFDIEVFRALLEYVRHQEAGSKPDANADEETLNP